ncbi:MAG: hypothetical protein A2Y10_02835 [Planctomycetes bacterium GWF2_41_51]|nr:MAG: hypothetical protein A2Y10_02835 [Planctomycetes bacterium GWF2_41_51]HBG27486.1 hypothetical protein [Phycisphaerales bacterium]
MNSFSNDVDILKYEPILFGDLHFAGQELISGIGANVSGSVLNAPGANFMNNQIIAGMVVNLRSEDSLIDDCYEIISIDSAAQLTVSIMRADGQAEIIPLKDAEDVSYKICTYQAQSNEIFLQLTQHFGLRPGVSDGQYSVDDILDVSVLRQVSVYGILSGVYATLSGKSDDKENYWKKSQYYRGLYEKALQRCRISFDLGDDGIADSVRSGSSVRLMRD